MNIFLIMKFLNIYHMYFNPVLQYAFLVISV